MGPVVLHPGLEGMDLHQRLLDALLLLLLVLLVVPDELDARYLPQRLRRNLGL